MSVHKPVEKEWFQIFVIIIVSISAFATGLIVSWPSPSTLKILDDKETYDITFDEISYFMVIGPVGMILSSLLFARMIDVVGRKWVLWSLAILQLITWLLTATARSVYVFYLMRFVAGTVEACMFTSLPAYVGEIVTPRIRGTWGNVPCFLTYVGHFAINGIGSYHTIPATAYVCMSFSVLFACIFPFMPESPYYLLMKNRSAEAKISLQRLRRKLDVDEELSEMKANVERQLTESGTWKDLVTIKSNRKAIADGAFLRASQQLSGFGTFDLYTQYIFFKAGGALSASTSAMILMGTCASLVCFTSFAVDKIGRRNCFFYSSLFCGVLLLGEAVYFIIEQFYPDVELDGVKWIPLVGLMGYMVAFCFGLANVPSLMLSELFSASVKGKGLCLMNIVFGLLLFSVPKVFHLLDKNVGLFAPFLLFSICCFASTAATRRFVPETQGKTLEEIQQSLKKTKC